MAVRCMVLLLVWLAGTAVGLGCPFLPMAMALLAEMTPLRSIRAFFWLEAVPYMACGAKSLVARLLVATARSVAE